MALVGNKADLESQREVSREVSILSSFMQISCVLMMTSAVVLAYSSGFVFMGWFSSSDSGPGCRKHRRMQTAMACFL